MSSESERRPVFWGDARIRETCWFCLPALLIGAILRITLLVQMPYGYFQSDTPDFLHTVYRWDEFHKFEMHAKKTFLVPLTFAVPFVLHVPALRFVPILQHGLGMLMIAAVGVLCRLWLRRWKWFVIPVTVLVAIHPCILWYEHAMMAEAIYVDCTVFLALAGTIFSLRQTWGSFALFCGALLLEAGARPEGKLFFAFGLLLSALVLWRDRRRCFIACAVMLALGVGTHFITKTSQAGLLLYTSVVHMTPDQLKAAPGLEPFIDPIKQDMIHRWSEHPSFPKANDRSTVAHSVQAYLESTDGRKRRNQEINDLCRKAAIETCARNLWRLPMHVYHKFRYYSNDLPSDTFNDFWMWDKQLDAYHGDMAVTTRLARGLFGFNVTTFEEVQRFVWTNFDPKRLVWFDGLFKAWESAVLFAHLPNHEYPGYVQPGIPLYFIIGTLGLIALMIRRDELWRFHFSWGGALLGLAFVIVLTANVKARFRFVFEPFLLLYIFALIDCVWTWCTAARGREPVE